MRAPLWRPAQACVHQFICPPKPACSSYSQTSARSADGLAYEVSLSRDSRLSMDVHLSGPKLQLSFAAP